MTMSQNVIDDILLPVLKTIYGYFQHEIKIERRTEIYKELEDRECIYSKSRRQFLQDRDGTDNEACDRYGRNAGLLRQHDTSRFPQWS